MKRTVFFDHYRLASEYDGTPVVMGRVGAATIYKASDLRSGAPVAVTLLPVASVASGERESFEEQGRAARLLDHMNIVRTVEFSRDDEDFVFVSEYPHGETVASWVTENGPMPPDAGLRVALQIVSALTAASFHRIHHRAIEPSNIMIVSGQTAEGGWPCVKLMNFAVAGSASAGPENGAAEFASPEQLKNGQVDFRSEIYSLGATLCFLLTGALYAAEPRSLQTRRFARPLRKVIAPMLRQIPEERPQDPIMVGQELRSCLQKVERRQSWARRFGIPFVPVSARPLKKRLVAVPPQSILAAAFEKPVAPGREVDPVVTTPTLWPRRILAAAAILLGAATVAAMLLPAPVSMILRRNHDSDALGIPVGVAQGSSAAAVPNSATPRVAENAEAAPAGAAPHRAMPFASPSSPDASEVASNQSTPTPSSSASQPVVATNHRLDAANEPSSPVPAPARASSPSSEEATARIVTANQSAAQTAPPTEGPQTVWERAAGSGAHPRIVTRNAASPADENNEDTSADQSVEQPNDSNDDQSSGSGAAVTSGNSKPRISSAPVPAKKRPAPYGARRDPRFAHYPPEEAGRSGRSPIHGSVRAQFAGMTPDGSLVLRFPNGETAIIPPPPGQYVPGHRVRRSRRVLIERRTMIVPPQPFVSVVPPDA